jgi:Na+-translocating ferredoxin:NAD+ oxidoreductase subunit D
LGSLSANSYLEGTAKIFFNPALFGRLFIIYAFPGTMNPWLSPVDGLATATPLQLVRSDNLLTPVFELFFGLIPGSLGETSALLLLLGAAYLLYNKYANWRIPVSVLAAVIIICLVTGENILFHLFSGSLNYRRVLHGHRSNKLAKNSIRQIYFRGRSWNYYNGHEALGLAA